MRHRPWPCLLYTSRQDLNAIEEASAYRKLIEDFGHSQEALAKLVGKSRSHVANLMRLLDLPVEVQDLVGDGSLSMGCLLYTSRCV